MSYEFKNGKHWVVCHNPYTGQINPVRPFKTKRGALSFIERHSDS